MIEETPIDETPPAVETHKKHDSVKVELRQLVGTTKHLGKTYRIAHDVDVILVNGKEVGQVGHKPGLGVGLLHRVMLTERERAAIVSAITKKRGVPPAGFTSPQVVQPQVLDDGDDGESSEYEYE